MSESLSWQHHQQFDKNYDFYWNITDTEMFGEIQVKAQKVGLIGIGFSRADDLVGADVVLGWIQENQFHLQVNSG